VDDGPVLGMWSILRQPIFKGVGLGAVGSGVQEPYCMWVTGERLSFFTMVAWFPKWAAGLLPGSASAGMLTGTVGEVVRQPVSALHTAVSLPVETCSRILCSSSEEFALVSWVWCSMHNTKRSGEPGVDGVKMKRSSGVAVVGASQLRQQLPL
jgi:hypothetical protein